MSGTPANLLCLIEGESIVFAVQVPPDVKVSGLKEVIQGKRKHGTLKDIDPHALELWKVRIIVPCESIDLHPHAFSGRHRSQRARRKCSSRAASRGMWGKTGGRVEECIALLASPRR